MDGILLVDKPAGLTSFDVVYKIRKYTKTKSVGHTGTLDPQATGVLVILMGRACKALPYLSGKTKEYTAELTLGIKTDTGDIWGNVIEEKEVKEITEQSVREVLNTFLGDTMQLPPMVSAIKKDGKKLYEYAREGITVERELRPVHIDEIELLAMEPKIRFRVVCSNGTYVRSLCEDIAEKLQTVGTMSALVRDRACGYTLDQCYTLEQIEQGQFETVSIYEGIRSLWPMIEIEEERVADVKNGKKIRLKSDEEIVALTWQNEVLAMMEHQGNGIYRCKRGLW